MDKFECKKCGSSHLGYQKYVKCITSVSFYDATKVFYEDPSFHTNDSLKNHIGYICRDCGYPLYHAGFWINTEGQLEDYFKTDAIIREEEQVLYKEYCDSLYCEPAEYGNLSKADIYELKISSYNNERKNI